MGNGFSDNKAARIYLAGHRGLVGGAILRALTSAGYDNLILKTSSELDLRDQAQVRDFYAQEKPEYVILAAARVGGIVANDTYPADFIYDNLMIESHLIQGAFEANVEKLVFLGSSCIYPKMSPQPIKETYLLSGPLEPTNEWYAVAKIAGIKLCQAFRKQHGCDFISAMPTNLYGPGDNFNLETSHVVPALMRKFHEAKITGMDSVSIWGSGEPMREFLHVDDLAQAVLFLLGAYSGEQPVNVGTGTDVRIRELAEMIKEVVGFDGALQYDPDKPDGTPRKLLDVSFINSLGWSAKVGLKEGLHDTYQWFLDEYDCLRR